MGRRITLFNTLGRTEMPFEPLEPGKVGLYTCGPTVYDYAHIGNLRAYIAEDLLRRMLLYFGYEVNHVMNVTDVGHLTSDADTGEDKMTVGARREGKSVWELARYYEDAFFEDCRSLNILEPTTVARATEHIPEMIELIQRLIDRGYAYHAGGNVYFSVDNFPDYGKMAGLRLDEQQAGARVDVDPNKRNPHDFVLWFTESKFPDQEMKWDSPFGIGFPGWHIECTAIASKYLGERVDIHCGGIDHIPVHHTNELAQSEAAFGHKWVNYWFHVEFLIAKDGKMSKSSGGFLTLSELEKQGFTPADYRYFCLQAHYRSPLQFTWEALSAAQSALSNLKSLYTGWLQEDAAGSAGDSSDSLGDSDFAEGPARSYLEEFDTAIASDLNVPRALGTVWKMARDQALSSGEKRRLLLRFDKVLGLGVADWAPQELPEDLRKLIEEREEARKRRDFATADALRDRLAEAGVVIKDTPEGTKWSYTPRT
ncbi:MAG: cysteine--tRNA ligase [Bacillota bacterium]